MQYCIHLRVEDEYWYNRLRDNEFEIVKSNVTTLEKIQ